MPDIPTSGEISLYDFYRDAPPLIGDFPVANPSLIWVLDPMALSSSINSVINNRTVGFINGTSHGFPTPLDTGGWATHSQQGASWNAGVGHIPPYIYLNEDAHYFCPINSLFPQNWTEGFTYWWIFHSSYQNTGSWKRIFHYGGGNGMNTDVPGYSTSTSEYSQLSSYLNSANSGWYWTYGIDGYGYLSGFSQKGLMYIVVSREPQAGLGGDTFYSFAGTSQGTYGNVYPTSSPMSDTPSWTTFGTNFNAKTSGSGRPQFGYTGYGSVNTSYTYHIRWYGNGMASRFYSEAERNQLVTWLNGKYFGGSY